MQITANQKIFYVTVFWASEILLWAEFPRMHIN